MKKQTLEPIKWQLVEVDKSKIKRNPNNPKIRDRKGYARLQKLREKYGTIFDGIVNADYSLIDGHARLEQEPEGIGNYFIPSRQLAEEDYKELNALFDLAKAGDIDEQIIEEIFNDEFFDEWELDKKRSKLLKESRGAKFPIVPEYDEKYEAIIIICKSQTEFTYMRNDLAFFIVLFI